MSAKKKDGRPSAGSTGRKPTEVKLYQMPENLDEMSEEEIEALARRVWESFRANARSDD